MDAFFASIEERDHEWLRGLPVVVGADPNGGRGRGVVSTANYKARAYGIHSAMPISQAWRLSEVARQKGLPPAVFVGGNHARYAEVSHKIIEIVRAHSPLVEEASIDEAFFDLSPADSWEKAEAICHAIKRAVLENERLTASIGVGPNKLIAKIASDFKKPDGLTVVHEETAEAFLEPMSVRKIPGIGPKTEQLLQRQGIAIVRDLKKFSREEMAKMLGKLGSVLHEKIRGRDDTPVMKEYEVKSIGEQETFAQDTRDMNMIGERLKKMCQGVLQSMEREGFTGFRTVTVTVRFSDFLTRSRSHTFPEATATFLRLHFEALKLLMPFFDRRENPMKKAIRLIGVRVEKLT